MIEQLESELRSAFEERARALPHDARARVRSRDYRPRTRDLRPPVAAGVLTTAAAASAAVLLLDLGPQAPAAFAGWSASPTPASQAQVADAKDACQSQLGHFSTGAGRAMKAARMKTPPSVVNMTPVLTDTRGPFTFVIFSGTNGANGTCISGPNFTSVSTRSGGAAEPPAGKIVASFEAHTAHASDAYSFLEGHAGTGVTAATLNLSDGTQVQTTLQNGWLVAWWPGSAAVTSAQVTTASGTTTQDVKTQPIGHCPQAPSAEATAKDVACASVGFSGDGKGQMAGSMSTGGMGGGGQAPGASGGTVTSGRDSSPGTAGGTSTNGG